MSCRQDMLATKPGTPPSRTSTGLGGSVLAVLLGCGPTTAAAERTSVSVFAASSLAQVFEPLESTFEQAHPSIDVQTSFAGSQMLRLQLEQGAAADIFASANRDHMLALFDAGLIGRHQVFAHNELVVIVPTDNPANIRSFADLPRARRLVLGSPNVPVGIYARQVIERARVQLGDTFGSEVLQHVVSEESNARLVRAKVELGEADAAFVYRTDATSSDAVQIVPIPPALNVRADYILGELANSPRPAAGAAFVKFVHSDAAQAVLVAHHFISESP